MVAYGFLILLTIISHAFFRYRAFHRIGTLGYQSLSDEEIQIRNASIEIKTITVFFVTYILLLGLRDEAVGIDAKSYINNYFLRFRYYGWNDLIQSNTDELGFTLLTKFIGLITSSPQLYLLLIAIVSVLPLMYLYRNESRDALLCCAFFLISLLFEAFFSALREGVALGLVAPAYYFTKKKKLVPFLLIVALASTFHLSALILVALYPIYHAKITFKWLWFVVPIMYLVYRYNSVIFNTLLVTMGGKYATKYLIYGYNATGQYGLLVLFVLISVYCFFMMDEEQADNDDIGFRNILLLSTALQLFAPLHVLASRMNYYFIIFIPIALTRTNAICKRRYWQIAKLAKVIMVVYFVFYFFVLKGDQLQIMNYQFCF